MSDELNTSAPVQGETAAPPDSPEATVAAKAEAVLAEAAEERPRRGRGRPRGSKTKNRRADGARVEAAPEPPAPPAEPTEAELRALAFMLSTAWRMVGARLRRRPLTPSEADELAKAAHPVLAKYGGSALEQWGPEIGLAFTLIGLWGATEFPQEDADHVFELGAGMEVPAS